MTQQHPITPSNYAKTMTQVELLIQQIRELKLTIKLHEEDLKVHQATLDEYRANGLLDPYEGEDGSYYVLNCRLLPVTRSSWKYSKAVKELQEREQVSGIATKQETTYLCLQPLGNLSVVSVEIGAGDCLIHRSRRPND